MKPRFRLLAAMAARVTLLAAAASSIATAQAVCSAPHSSPALASGGSIGTLARGSGWVQISAFAQRSTESFGVDGVRQPFLADGDVRTTSLYITSGVGLARGLDGWAQLPVHNLRFSDRSGVRTRTGVGDLRVSLRVSPDLFGMSAPVAVRAGVKLPGSEFPIDATIIPLTEGQRDWEVSMESGHAFGRIPFYLLGWVGYRWREENRKAARKPGDEIFTHIAVGGNTRAARWELAVETLDGRPPRQLGLSLSGSRRELFELAPTLGRRVGRGELEVTGLLPVTGRDLPAGAGYSVGYRVHWGEP